MAKPPPRGGFHIGATILLNPRPATRLKYAAGSEVLPAVGPKNVIPKRRADAVTGVIVVIMMTQMVLFKPVPNAAFHWKMMDRVMN
jgi:hypothetical protein